MEVARLTGVRDQINLGGRTPKRFELIENVLARLDATAEQVVQTRHEVLALARSIDYPFLREEEEEA